MDPESMTDMEFAKTLLSNMPVDSNWRNFMSGLRQEYSKKVAHPGSIEVINTIRDEYWAQHKDDPETYLTVFSAKYHAEGTKKRQLDNESRSSERPNSKRQQQVPQTTQWRDKLKLRCTVKDCESPTRHEAHECFAYGGGKQGQYLVWYRGPRDIHLPKAQQEFRKTRPRVNQTSADSTLVGAGPIAHPNQDQSSRDTRSTFSPPAPASSDDVNQVTVGSNQVWMVQIEPGVLDNAEAEPVTCAIPIERMEKSDGCYHDSGSNRHVFHGREYFDEYREIAPVRVHAFGEGLMIAATGAGTVKLRGQYKGKSATFTVTNCLHIPGAWANLISQIRLDKVGVSTWFDDGNVTLFKKKVPYIEGKVHNDLYRLNMHPIKTGKTADVFAMAAKSPERTPDFYTA
jgi:hypothetical protein